MALTADAVKPKGWLLLVAQGAIFTLALFGGAYLWAALAAAAVVTAVVMLWRPARTLPWRLATVATCLWAVEEVVWLIQRLNDTSLTSLVTEVTYYLGLAFWLVAILLMPRKRMPAPLVLAALPAVGLLIWLLFLDPPSSITLAFPLFETLLVIVALPLLGGTMSGGASEGRVLVVLAFYFRALGAGSFAWLAGTEAGSAALVLWLGSYLMLALGAHLELEDRHAAILPVGLAIASLQAVSAGLLVLLYKVGMQFNPYVITVVTLLAYVQFAVVMLLLVTSRANQRLTESELRAWSRALESVSESPDDDAAVPRVLHETLSRVPHAQGLEVHGGSTAGALVGYAYPLVAGGAEIGRLYLTQRPARTTVLDTCAPMLASKLHLISDRDRWAAAALTDPLTSLLNRRGLELRADVLFAEAQANGSPLTVAMLDIDHFKRVNDVYGHEVGDKTLKALATILREHLRPHDQAVRWGGEEFVVVLPALDPDQAIDVLKRVRQELSGANLHPIAWPLAVSVGIAGSQAPRGGQEELKRLIDTADAALARAKRGGRNRIVRAGALPD